MYQGIQERVAVNCLKLRERRGWTQEQAAHQAQMSTRLLQRIENSQANLTLTTLARLTEGFDVDVSELFRKPRDRR
ncbi:MAG TPA: helix-turn-helix transcriptional regulator [Kofleriaceae bacterium]|nr:helix-turn-helix transcriptional regulator [Kofleriaceae bacterium]